MQRFYFHFRENGATAIDDAGLELDSLEAAYLAAFTAAQDMWRERLKERRDPRDCAFEIADGLGRVLMTLPFEEVLEACRGGKPERRAPARKDFAHILDQAPRFDGARREVMLQLAALQATLRETRQLMRGSALTVVRSASAAMLDAPESAAPEEAETGDSPPQRLR
jgi:hypothetical protein